MLTASSPVPLARVPRRRPLGGPVLVAPPMVMVAPAVAAGRVTGRPAGAGCSVSRGGRAELTIAARAAHSLVTARLAASCLTTG